MVQQLDQRADRARASSTGAAQWGTAALCMLLLAMVAAADYVTGKDVSFTLLYLLPISGATWFAGRRVGFGFCLAATAAGLLVACAGPVRSSLATMLWNAGVRLGICLAFWMLLSHLKAAELNSNRNTAMISRLNRLLSLSVLAACVLAAAGWAVQREIAHRPIAITSAAMSAPHPANAMSELSALVQSAMRASRPVLLGSRDPTGPSCISPVRRGELQGKTPTNAGDYNGGPGTTIATLYSFDRKGYATSPHTDYAWHQSRLKTFLENESALNAPAAQRADELAEKARRVYETITAAQAWPAELSAVGFDHRNDWPSYCLSALDKAAAARDLAGAKHWAGELSAATFALADLHRWLGLLVENHLLALRFQRQCEGVFVAADSMLAKYDPDSTISQFPAGVLSLNGWGNYYEVEHQAERLFSMPADRVAEISTNEHLLPGSLWVSPALRETFLKLEGAFASPANRGAWEQAARTPYEHSYLINMLYRAARADSANDLYAVLQKFDAIHPSARAAEIMSVLMYRGHSFGGLEWADRFQPQLLAAANQIPTTASDIDALLSACRWTNRFYVSPSAEYGVTFTLRDALQARKLDCVRSTDMIGAIFRNSGRTRFGHVRWCSETAGHSVAAYLGGEPGKPQTLLADGLNPPADRLEVFPDCYFHGHAWPPGMEHNTQPYAVELYVRGLDNYLWTQGYIIRGPSAGWLTNARIPYSTRWAQASSQRIFAGPYPQ